MPVQPSLNLYGSPGLMDVPTAEALPDGQLAVSYSFFGGVSRSAMTFQFSPRISATFRYVGIQNWNSNGFDTYRDRNFDIRFLLRRETLYWPAITVGLQDFAGTGINAAEYVVATRTFDSPLSLPGTLRVTAGLGWGRLGTDGSIGSPLGNVRPSFDPNSKGGTLATDQWFRGPAAPFAGIEWQIDGRWALKAELSTDAYTPETSRGVFTRKSRFNFGAEYQHSPRLRLGAYWMYGAEFGLSVQFQINPAQAVTPLVVAGPRPIQPRPELTTSPDAWSEEWSRSASAPQSIRDALAPALEKEGLSLDQLSVSTNSAELRFINRRYASDAAAIGRAARVMAQQLPASVETFRLVVVENNLALSTIILRRSDLEALEFAPNSADALLAVAGFSEAAPDLPGAIYSADLYPSLAYSIGPYVTPSYFDPDSPIRADAGLSAEFRYRFAPGWLVAGEVQHRLVGNISDSRRFANSRLPKVRTDALRYAQAGDTTLRNLYISKQWKPRADTYARVSAGYLEAMFGGVSAEVLWKPVNSRLALGVEANYVRQRDFEQRLGFADYSAATGHVSAYYEFGGGYHGQLEAGRYLAGDVGGTATVTREFANGWRVGGFFTLTDVSAADFGEGSFDKGILLSIPVSWFIGQPSKRTVSTTIRPIQRDGGARLAVPGRLYEQVRHGHRSGIAADFGRVWE
nr:YjbH domain-containing protein [Pseudosulfitobacter koreense]